MSDLRADCDWHDGTLFLVLPEDPERIAVRLFPSRQAPSRVYAPEGEVVKLRQQLSDVTEIMGRVEMRCAKLRELCTALYKCRDKVSECATCEDVACPFMNDCRLHDRMRTLGVEVP